MSMQKRAGRCAIVFKALMLGLEIIIEGQTYCMNVQFKILQRGNSGDHASAVWLQHPSETRDLVLLCERMTNDEFATIANNVAMLWEDGDDRPSS